MKQNTLKGLTVLCSALLVVMMGVGSVLEDNCSMVDDALGTVSTRVITDDDASLYTFKVDEEYNTTDKLFEGWKDLSTQMSTEGVTLLKNVKTSTAGLPLKSGAKVTLLGNCSNKPWYGGNMHGLKANQDPYTFKEALEEVGFSVNPVMDAAYTAYKTKPNYMGRSMNMAYNYDRIKYTSNEPAFATIAKNATEDVYETFDDYHDAGIVVIGRSTAEAGDYFTGEKGTNKTEGGSDNSLGFTGAERELITIAKENFDNVIVFINADNPMEIGELKDDAGVDAVLWTGMLGQYGARGVANVLKGTSPSGALTDIYVYDNASHPADQNFGVYLWSNYEEVEEKTTKNPKSAAYLNQTENIYNGYRYYETRYYDAVMGDTGARSTTGTYGSRNGWKYSEEVTYGFGFGLSYTTFDFKLNDVNLTEGGKYAVVKGEVKNTGSVASKTPIQVYVNMPYEKGGIEKSAIQLADFEKSGLINPGETESFEIKVDMSYVAPFDQYGEKTYIMDRGDYYFSVGNGAHEALNNILALQGKTPANTNNYMDDTGDKDAAAVVRNAYATNKRIFATSKAGKEVKNLFDDFDLNYWETGTTVKYLSRADWSGTYPTPILNVTANEKLINAMKSNDYTITPDEEAAKDIYFCREWKKGLTISDMKGAEYDDPRWHDFLSEMKLEEVLNTVLRGNGQIYGMDSINSAISYAIGDALGSNNTIGKNADPNDPCWGGKDPKEDPHAGDYARCVPTAPVIGATFNKELSKKQGQLSGISSIYNNTTVCWGPLVACHRGTGYGRISETYSEDPVVNGFLCGEFCAEAWRYGQIVTAKHFALNNIEINRVGLAEFGLEQGLREIELRAFQIAFENGCLGLMSAFNRIGARWASANRTLMTDLLREEWGWKGYAITDIVSFGYDSYMSAKDAIWAGSNIFDNTSSSFYKNKDSTWGYFADTELPKLKQDKVWMDQLERNTHELFWMVVNSNAMNGVGDNTRTEWLLTWWRGIYIGGEILFGAGALACAGFFFLREFKKTRKED